MFGEFSGAVGAAYGPQSGSESRISSSILPRNSGDAVDSGAIPRLTLVVDLPAERRVKTTPESQIRLLGLPSGCRFIRSLSGVDTLFPPPRDSWCGSPGGPARYSPGLESQRAESPGSWGPGRFC